MASVCSEAESSIADSGWASWTAARGEVGERDCGGDESAMASSSEDVEVVVVVLLLLAAAALMLFRSCCCWRSSWPWDQRRTLSTPAPKAVDSLVAYVAIDCWRGPCREWGEEKRGGRRSMYVCMKDGASVLLSR